MRPQQSAVSALQTPITSDDQDVGTALADANLPSPELTDSSQDCSVGENQARELPDHHVLDDNILLPTSMGSPTLSALEAIMCTMPPSTSEAGESVLAPGLLDAGDSELLSDPFVSFPPFHDLGGQLDMHDAEDIEEVIRPTMPISAVDCETWTLKFTSPHSSDSSSSPEEPSNSLVRGPFTYLYEQPSFPQDSPEMLTLRFDRLTCGILSVKDGPSENPWRSLIWPLTQQSPALYHAISSMTAFHSSRDVPSLRLTGHEHKDASIRNLGEGVHENSMNLDTAIATTLALAFAEVWDQHTSSGNVHIKGAKTMINIALEQHRRQAKSGLELARLKFLCNAWVYMDVIARLTSTDSDDSEDYDQLYCLYSTGSETDAGFGIDFGMPIDAQLDPLMGCASTLFPLIGRAANLVRRVRRASSNSPPVISQAMELKLLLETWDPPAFIEPPEDPTSSVQHTLQTAEAYRWATLLYLHQAVPEIPSLSSKEMAKKVLVYLATVPLASRCVIVHIYPLMAAGCEATTAEDRQWVRDRWNAMALRMRIGPLDKCMEVTEEVWRRKDEYDSRPINTRALVSTAELQISGIMSLKRACSSVDEGGAGWLDGFGPDRLQRRMTDTSGFRKRRGSREGGGQADLAHTVRGELHWLSVMQDWGWEGNRCEFCVSGQMLTLRSAAWLGVLQLGISHCGQNRCGRHGGR